MQLNETQINEIIGKYVVQHEGINLLGQPTAWAHLHIEPQNQLTLGVTLGEAKCIQCGQASPFIEYGWFPVHQRKATDFSNAIVPPLCGKHLLAAIQTHETTVVHALLAIDEKLKAAAERADKNKAYWGSPEVLAEKAARKTYFPSLKEKK